MKLSVSILFLFATKATCYYTVCNCTLKIEGSEIVNENLPDNLKKPDLDISKIPDLDISKKPDLEMHSHQKTPAQMNMAVYGASLKKNVEDINMSAEVIAEATTEAPKNAFHDKITKMTKLIDAFTSNLTYTVTKNEFRPIRIPNFHKEYKNTKSPSVRIHIADGYLKFISKINRVGSSSIALNENELVLTTPIILKKFDVNSQYTIESANFECKGNISAEIEDLNFSLVVAINLENSLISLQTLKLTNLRKIDIALIGNVNKRFRKLIEDQYKKVVYHVVEHTIFDFVREELQKNLATLNFEVPYTGFL